MAEPAVPVLSARVTSSRLRVGAFRTSGDAVTLVQGDDTTCGATTVLAAHLLLGGDGGLPGALAASSAAEPVPARPPLLPGLALQQALTDRQRRLQSVMNRRSRGPLGPLPWSRRIGSPPWAVAAAMTATVRRARPGTAAYTVRWVRDQGSRWPDIVEDLRGFLAGGVPVVLLSGGPLVRRRPGDGRPLGVLSAVLGQVPSLPRHYVLALPWDLLGAPDPGQGRAHVYDPSSGAVRVLDLLAPRPSTLPGPRELGAWPRVMALICPGSSVASSFPVPSGAAPSEPASAPQHSASRALGRASVGSLPRLPD